jgi:isopenicillin-N N-acyltransferase-like protein
MARTYMLPVIEASGKPFDMGRMIGRKCAAKAAVMRRNMAAAIAHSTGASWESALRRAGRHLPYAEEFYPDYVEEIRGYAEGARIEFEDVFACCCHELLSPLSFKGCTDIAVSGDVTLKGNTLAAHNEDWSEDGLGTVVLLHARPSAKPEFVCTAYGGILPSSGMNNAGITLTGNALEQNDVRIGVPKVFPARRVLEARRIGEALSWAMPRERASSYNNICCDRNGEIYSLEGSATDCAWLYADDGYMVHTNHYTSDRMRRYEADPSATACSIFRYHRAERLIRGQLGSVTAESLMEIMRDHANKPCSICRHADQGRHPLDVSETIFSVIYDLSALEAHVVRGKPCSGTYSRFKLGND